MKARGNIIDAHHHLWHYNNSEYGWIDESMSILKRDYLPDDLLKEITGSGVSGTVVVQARQTLEESRWLLDLSSKYPFIKGVVAWVDLCSAELTSQLYELSANPALVGVRHVIHDEPDDNFMLRPDFIRGIEQLSSFNLTYDLLLFPKHLGRAIELVNRFPEQKFVLDHISKPFIRTGILQPWKDDIEALAAQPNVWCKISGMVTEARHKDWKYEDFYPYLDVIYNAFGSDRLMLGSDWPVCRLAGEYNEVMDIPVRYFETLSSSDREKIFSTNCVEFYNLK